MVFSIFSGGGSCETPCRRSALIVITWHPVELEAELLSRADFHGSTPQPCKHTNAHKALCQVTRLQPRRVAVNAQSSTLPGQSEDLRRAHLNEVGCVGHLALHTGYHGAMGLDEAQEVHPGELGVDHQVHQLRLAVLGHRAVFGQEGDLSIVACADGQVRLKARGFSGTHVMWWGSRRMSAALQSAVTVWSLAHSAGSSWSCGLLMTYTASSSNDRVGLYLCAYSSKHGRTHNLSH